MFFIYCRTRQRFVGTCIFRIEWITEVPSYFIYRYKYDSFLFSQRNRQKITIVYILCHLLKQDLVQFLTNFSSLSINATVSLFILPLELLAIIIQRLRSITKINVSLSTTQFLLTILPMFKKIKRFLQKIQTIF